MKSSAGYNAGMSLNDPTSALRLYVTALQETRSEVPALQRNVDVFLDIPMAGLVKGAGDLIVAAPV